MISANISKTEANRLYKIKTYDLRKWGFFKGFCSGTVTWGDERSETGMVVKIEASIFSNEKYLRLQYTQNDRETGGEIPIDRKTALVTTHCHFGGQRYWFVCRCGRRVGVFYKCGAHFACRHCHELTYRSRNLSGRHKAFGHIDSYPDLLEKKMSLRRTYYKGKPTRKYMRFLYIEQKAIHSYTGELLLLNDKIQKTASKIPTPTL